MSKVTYYAKFVLNTSSQGKTPKYTIVEEVGFYPPMEELRSKDNKITMYLIEKLKEGSNVPSMRLQAKGSLNFTGLKEWFENGKLSGFAYGYPYDKPTYSSKAKKNPFYEYRNDGFLFVSCVDDKDPNNLLPQSFEMIVIEGARFVISALCKQMQMGGFDEVLNGLRKLAIS